MIGAITTAGDELFNEGQYREAVELARAAAQRFAGENTEIIFTAQAERMAAALYDDFDAALAAGSGREAFDLAQLIGSTDMMKQAQD